MIGESLRAWSHGGDQEASGGKPGRSVERIAEKPLRSIAAARSLQLATGLQGMSALRTDLSLQTLLDVMGKEEQLSEQSSNH